MSYEKIAVVIPCYRVRAQIGEVLASIGPEVWRIYLVDDCCPESAGDHAEKEFAQERLTVLRNPKNLGVGGAMVHGYKQALSDGAEIVVKMDGDGQMDGAQIPHLIRPIKMGWADYAKGNRFYDFSYLRPMPWIRLAGNSVLSLITKVSSGYWNIMDPTNGFTAIHSAVLKSIELDKLEKRYFFESDMLYRLYLLRAVIWDVPMPARYRDEISSLKISLAIFEFSIKNFVRTLKRIFYSYFLRDFQIGSIMLVAGICLAVFGGAFGSYHWYAAIATGSATPLGTIMLAALPSLVGLQMLLTFFQSDIQAVPARPIHSLMPPPDDSDAL